MLPLLRVTLLGCVLIATLGLAAGFNVAAGPQPTLGRVEPPARGALIVQEQHPEWKLFLVLAAVRRAEELERLRILHEQPATTPVESEPPPRILTPPESENAQPEAARSAGLPAADAEVAPDDDVTGTVTERAINNGLPIDIGEASSTELPIGPPQTVAPPPQPPRIELPDQNSSHSESKATVAAKSDVAERPEAKREPTSVAAKPAETKPATAKPRRAKAQARQPAAAQQESAANPLAALFSIFEQTGTDSRP